MSEDHWRQRWMQAMRKADTTGSPKTREAYLTIAGHYLAMDQLIGRGRLSEAQQSKRMSANAAHSKDRP